MAQQNLLLMLELLLPLVSPTAHTLSGSEAGQRTALSQSFLRCRIRSCLQVQKPNPPLQVGLPPATDPEDGSNWECQGGGAV